MKFNDIDIVRKYSRQYDFNIRSTDTGENDVISPNCLACIIQEAASLDACNLGFGAPNLEKENIVWILIRTSVRIYEPLMWRQKAIVDTWTNGVSGIYALREFNISGVKGEVFAKASTSWILADKNTKRPVRVDVLEDKDMEASTYSSLGFESPKIRLNDFEILKEPLLSVCAKFSDIDRNGHVNNTKYISQCLDALDYAGENALLVNGFDINYVSEVLKGEMLDIFCHKISSEKGFNSSSKKTYLIVGKHRETKKISFSSFFYLD